MSDVSTSKQASKQRLVLPLAAQTRFVLVRPHYPENLGASARAMKTMGLSRMTLVRPGRLCHPTHPMAQKMAVKSLDVLEQALLVDELEEALVGVDYSFGASAKPQRGVFTLERAAAEALRRSQLGQHLAVVFGNEKSGLSDRELELCDASLRIPMAAPQPSINLAQACQLVAYQLFVAGLDAREEDSKR